MVNPYIYKTSGDLSKADVVVLSQLSTNRRVVEYGVGGSTVLFNEIAQSTISYDTSQEWIDKIKPQCSNVVFNLIPKEAGAFKGKGTDCDVVFSDGHSLLRAEFIMEFWKHASCFILHDSRMLYASNIIKKLLDSWERTTEPYFGNENMLPNNPYLGSLDYIKWNYLDSNMVVILKKPYTLKYENWNITE